MARNAPGRCRDPLLERSHLNFCLGKAGSRAEYAESSPLLPPSWLHQGRVGEGLEGLISTEELRLCPAGYGRTR